MEEERICNLNADTKALSKVAALVSKYTFTSKRQVVKNPDHYAMEKGLWCYVIHDYYPYLIKQLCEIAEMSRETFSSVVSAIKKEIQSNDDLRCKTNFILSELKLPEIARMENKGFISNTKRIFGFDYSDKDIKRRIIVGLDSCMFMHKLCRSNNPTNDKFSQERLNNHRVWYNS